MALMLNGLDLAVGDPARGAPLVHDAFPAPARRPGPITVRTRVERAGRTLTSVSGRLEQDGKLMGLALGARSRPPWESPLLDEAPMPDVEPSRRPHRASAAGCRRSRRLRSSTGWSSSTASGRRCSAAPSTPRSAAGSACGRSAPLDAPAVAVLADAWFPAPWPRLRALAPAPTIDLTIHFRAPLPIDDTLLLGRFRTRLVRDGFFDEDGELWAPDGTLVAQSRQLGLLIGAEA